MCKRERVGRARLFACPSSWTGYFVSRPDFKADFHSGSAFFRGASMLHALARDSRTWLAGARRLLPLWRAVGIAQHHDTITGDCYDNVCEDVAQRVRSGVTAAAAVASEAAALLSGAADVTVGGSCTNFTLTPCAALVELLEMRQPAAVTFFNPSAWPRRQSVSLLSPTQVVVVTDGVTGAVVPSQTAPYRAPDLPPLSSWSSVVFDVELPPLGSASVVLTATGQSVDQTATLPRPPSPTPATPTPTPHPLDAAGGYVLSNGFVAARFSSNGTLESLTAGETTVSIVAKALFYSSDAGAENAWNFRSNHSVEAHAFDTSAQRVAWHAEGASFSELAVSVDEAQGVFLRYRLYAGERALHLYTGMGPFSANTTSTDGLIRFETDIASEATWLTDSNGLELQPRRRWSRPWFPSALNYTDQTAHGPEPVSINMYPVTAAAVLPTASGAGPALGLVTANSHGCTSMSDGALELTLNRNVLDQSGRRLTGNRLVTQHTVVVVGPSRQAVTTAVRRLSADMSNPVLAFAADAGLSGKSSTSPFAPLASAFPPELALVSLQLLPAGFDVSALFGVGSGASDSEPSQKSSSKPSAGVVLLRLRHIYQRGLDDPTHTAPASVDLAAVFAPQWRVASVVEMVVDGSQTMADAQAARHVWPQATTGGDPPRRTAARRLGNDGTVVTLQPMEIKTFALRF